MSALFEKMDAKWHHSFRRSSEYTIDYPSSTEKIMVGIVDGIKYFKHVTKHGDTRQILKIDFKYVSPGFWFTTDENDKVIRCGCHMDLRRKMGLFEPWDNEEKFYASLSWWDGDTGFQEMKQFKQEFRRRLLVLVI